MRRKGWRGWAAGLLVGLVALGGVAQPVYIESLGSFAGALDGQFTQPRALALDAAGNLYVADTGNARIQRFDLAAGVLSHAWSFGVAGSAAGQFDQLYGIAVDAAGNVYTAETGTDRIQRFAPGGGSLVFDFASGSLGAANGQFNNPIDLAIGPAGDLYVVDAVNRRLQIFTPGPGSLTHAASFNAGGQFQSLSGVAVGSDGTIYLVDEGTDKLYTAARLGGVVGLTKAVTTPTLNPTNIAINASGSLYTPVRDPDKLVRYGYDGVSLLQQAVASNVGLAPLGDPEDVAVDGWGNVYVADIINHQVHRWFDPNAIAPGNTATLANLTIGNLSNTLTLSAGKSVNVLGSTIVEPGATMTVQSDLFTTNDLGVFGGTYNGKLAGVTLLTFHSGTLKVTDAGGLTIDAAGPTAGAMTITTLKALNVTNALTVDTTGTLTLVGGAVSAAELINNGTINASGATVTLTQATSVNNAQMILTAGGLRLTKSLSNAGTIAITDSALRIDTAFTNQAAGQLNVAGLSTLRFDAGATNQGVITFNASDILTNGAFINAEGALIDLTAASNVTFGGAMTNDGTISIAADSSARFSGNYSGSGAITGGGPSTFVDAVRPGGDDTAIMNVAGDATLLGSLTIQLGGTTPGTGHDQLVVGGALTLDGILAIQLVPDAAPQYDTTFIIIDAGAGTLSGQFAAVTGLQLTPDYLLELVYDTTLNQVRLVAPPSPVVGDTDNDADIDDFDLISAITGYTGSLPPGTGGKTRADGDTDADADVDDFDLINMLTGYTGSLSPGVTTVPEPGSLWTVALVMLARLRRRRPV